MIMYDDCDLSEIEERLYSQIYHSTDRESEQHQTQLNENLIMNSKKRYFDTNFNAGIPKISLRINVHNRQKMRYITEDNNLKKKYDPSRKKVTQKLIHEQRLRNVINASNCDVVKLKEIKAQVNAFPELVNYLPQHIRKRLRKMKKRLAFIQKKIYLDTIKKLNQTGRPKRSCRQSVNPSIKDPIEIRSLPQSKINCKKKDETIISVCDKKMNDSKTKQNISFIEISSSDEETDTAKLTNKISALNDKSKSTNKDVFKRPDDDDVIFMEPNTTDIINIENDSESNGSVSTKSSIDRSINRKQKTNLEKQKLLRKEGKELFSTAESNNSNDFLESTLADDVSSGFNFELHGTDFGPSKDSSRVIVKDVSGSESSCSVATCDLGGLLASNKCDLFNEVDFESPSKNIFEESNMESFGNYIIPNRTYNKPKRNIVQSSPLLDKSSEYSLKKKRQQKEELPNLSSIAPKETNDLEESVLFDNAILPSDVKKKKKTKKLIEMDTEHDVEHVTDISCDSSKKKKGKNALQSLAEDVVKVTTIENISNVLPKLKIKRKKTLLGQQDKAHSAPDHFPESHSYVTDSQTKKKKKHKKPFNSNDNDTDEMDSSVQIIEETTINTDLSTILQDDEPKKKKKNRPKKISEFLVQDNDNVCELINNDSSEFGEATKKRKRKSKTLTIHREEHIDDVQTTDDTIKRKRKNTKFSTSNTDSRELIASLGGTVQSVIEDGQNELMKIDKSIMIDTTASCTSSLQFECDVLKLETSEVDVSTLSNSRGHSVSTDQNSCITISDSNISISSESDYDFSNIKGDGVQIVNVKFKAKVESFDADSTDYLENILINMSDDVSLWKILAADRKPAKSPARYKLRCRKCREIGHFANQCKKKYVYKCCLCGGRGHLEPRCPNKLCTSCGRRSNFFTTFCSRCAHMKHSLCKICKIKGHDQSRCPDLWRRYHLTITDGPIILPNEEDGLLVTKWCSGCGKEGHLEYQCQYFAREHSPTIPYVIDYKDHMYRGNTSSLSSVKTVPSKTSSKSVTQSVNFNTASTKANSSSLLNIGVVEQLSQQIKSDPQQHILPSSCANSLYIETKPPIFKTILPIPQPIGSSSIKIETDLVVASDKESPICTSPEPMELCTTPPFSQSPLFFDQPSTSCATSLFSMQCPVTYLHAKYLRFHKVGISKIIELSTHNTTKITINPDGNINVQSALETICASSKNEILNHLQGVCPVQIPTEKNLLTTYLEEILMDLSKEYTVIDLRTCFTILQDNISLDKSINFQQLNMMIYGHFKWENGDRCMNKMQKLLNIIKEHDNIEDKFLNELKDCLRYLIEFERPIHMYSDIIESISEGKRNFFNVESLRIPEKQPSLVKAVIIIDPMKFDYVKNSFPAKFMIFRWTSKLDVTYCDKNGFSVVLEGNPEDISSAIREFGRIVGEGSILPDSKWAVFNIISHLFTSIDSLENYYHHINKRTMALLVNENKLSKRSALRKNHYHLIVMRGLNGGFEKLIVLREFVNNYKPSLENDNLTYAEKKQIQAAFDTVQFNSNRTIFQYKSIYTNPSTNTKEKIIVDVEEYRILKEAKEHTWFEKIDLSSPTVMTSKYRSISIVGTSEDRRVLKLSILEYLDRAYIFDDNPKTLIIKLENSLKKLWTKPLKRNEAQTIMNRIYLIESKNIDSYHIDTLRKLYEQLHIYLFGCCRLDIRTKTEAPSNNHVDILRAYIAYLETVSVVPTDIQKSIYETYNSIFCKEKIRVTYKSLINVAWTFYNKYKNIDRGTIYICDPRLKSYLIRSSMDTSSLLSHSIIHTNPIIAHENVRNFLKDSFMIIVSNDVKYNLPIEMRKESYKLFCGSYSNIVASISICLQTIDEIRSYLHIRKAMDLLDHIQALEDNSQECRLIQYNYHVINIYLFGCCLLKDGLEHFNRLKSCHVEFSQPDKGDEYITDIDLMNNLMDSYEYIFWKGKKTEINYNNLLNGLNVTNEYAVTTISLHSNYIYDYFTHVSEGIDLVDECSAIVKVDIEQDDINENGVLIKLTGGSGTIENVTNILLTEIDRLGAYKDIPFQIDSFRKFLNSKLEELINIGSSVIPMTFLRDIETATQLKHLLLPQCECINVCLIKKFLCCKLNKYIFGGYQPEEGQLHLRTMITLATDLHNKRNITLTIKQIETLYRSLQYFFSQKLSITDYEQRLQNYASMEKYKRKLPLLPLVYDYLKSINDLSYLFITQMQLVFDKTSPFVSVSGSNSYLSWIRDILYQYNNILSKVPKNRHDLIIFLNKSFQTMQELEDPKSIWINICLIEQRSSNHTVELKELYVKLHRHLFGYFQLGNGKALQQILYQHLINLSMICNPHDIIPMDILQEIFFALEYIEGSRRQFSSQEYEELINESCRYQMKNKSNFISQITINSSATALNAATDTNELIESNTSLNVFNKCDNAIQYVESNKNGVSQNFLVLDSNFTNPNIHVIPNDQEIPNKVQVIENISQKYLNYLKHVRAGRLLVFQLRRLVDVKITPRSIILTGSENNVKIALTLKNSQRDRNACYQCRNQIRLAMQLMKRKINIASFYPKVLTRNGKIQKNMFQTIHSYLFGNLKLCDGAYHIDVLTKFLHSDEIVNSAQLNEVKESYRYIFGSKRKSIDYVSIIQSVTANNQSK